MKVKLINAALRRVAVPDLSPTNRESFTAGVRALAYELEKDTTPEPVTFTEELQTLIRKAFDNEAAFLTRFGVVGFQLEELYVGADVCIMVTTFIDRTTIKTADFLEWAHDQN